MSDPIIRLDGVNKWYGDFQVLTGIDLSVRTGERIVICGPSGSGKSTLIRCINRLETVQKGSIVVDGIELTAGGKNITPSELENELKFSPYITDAVVIGDQKPYLVVVIMVDQENVEKFAQDNDVPFSNYASLTRAQAVQDLIQSEITRVNEKFARVEQIKKFFLLDTQLSAEDDELTPTMKLKRKFVQQKYAAQIDAMYKA